LCAAGGLDVDRVRARHLAWAATPAASTILAGVGPASLGMRPANSSVRSIVSAGQRASIAASNS
jgi:hypothetical protein